MILQRLRYVVVLVLSGFVLCNWSNHCKFIDIASDGKV